PPTPAAAARAAAAPPAGVPPLIILAPLPACRPAVPPVNRAVAAAPPRSTVGVFPAPDPVGAAPPATRPPPGVIRWPARGPTPGRPPGRLREVSSARLPPGPTGATTGPPGRGPDRKSTRLNSSHVK